MRTAYKSGMTLLELLVAFSIIAILATIGFANYLSAVGRARYSKVSSDLRAISAAVEAYTVDNSRVPRMAHRRFYNDISFDFYNNIALNGTLSRSISTPVAYLSGPFLLDPYAVGQNRIPLDERFYTFQVLKEYEARENASGFWGRARSHYGEWRLGSIGPDQAFSHRFRNSAQLPYDPTNGLSSLGNIWRSQRYDAPTLPPIPGLLAPH